MATPSWGHKRAFVLVAVAASVSPSASCWRPMVLSGACPAGPRRREKPMGSGIALSPTMQPTSGICPPLDLRGSNAP